MLINYKSQKKISPFAADWEFNFFQTQMDDVDCINDMKQLILVKEPQIIKQFPESINAGGTGLGANSLTAKFKKFNIFNWTENCFVKFQNFVREEHSKFIKEMNIPERQLYVGCWANVLRHGQKIDMHWHITGPNSYLGAHMCLTEQETSTIYSNPFLPNALFNPFDKSKWLENSAFEFKNKSGSLLFFPDWLIHYTTPYYGNAERITIAMDILTEEHCKLYANDEITKNYVRFN
jgi:hypothetical protein